MPFPTRQCRGQHCKTKIVWATVADTGELIPLDASAPVYHVVDDGEGGVLAMRATEGRVLVSHFSTCVDAGEFSRHRKGEADATQNPG